MTTLAINTSADPWGGLILIGIIAGICAFPFVVGGLVDLSVQVINVIFCSEENEFDNMNAGIAAGFVAAFIEFFVLCVFVIPHYS